MTGTAEGLSAVAVLGAILRYRRMVIAIALGLALAVGLLILSRDRTYTATAAFTPQATRQQLGGLGGLAAQFGVAVPGGESNQSPAFYADLLKSRAIMEPLIHTPLEIVRGGQAQRGTYLDFERVRGADSARRTVGGLRKLSKDMSAGVATKTGVVRVEVTSHTPQLSALLVQHALDRLNSFNVQTRRSQAAAQRQFLEERMATVSRELQAAEDAVRDFAQQNRGDLRFAPQLLVQQERLNRVVMQRSQVYGTLSQALEQAKLDEIRDTPLITVIETPVVPANPDPRGLIVKTFLTVVLGTILGSLLALVRHALAVQRAERPESFAQLSAEFTAVKSDLRRLVSPLRRPPVANGRR